MVLMTTTDEVVVRGGPFTLAQRDALPDDGRRHELLEGVLVMTPSPSGPHQTVVKVLLTLLDAGRPADLLVRCAPLDVMLGPDTVIEPDLLVCTRSSHGERGVAGPPLLAVEVLSPSTRPFDLGRKRQLLEAAGCPSYWVVDPDSPSLTAWELADGQYVQGAEVIGDEAWTASSPYAVTIRPADLLQD